MPAHVAPAIDELLRACEIALEKVTEPSYPANWNAIALDFDVVSEKLNIAWGAVSHLNSVADTPELRAAYNLALPKISEYSTRVSSNKKLYAKIKAINVATLNAEQRQAHKNTIRSFVLSGAELVGAAKARFAKIQERQAELSQKYSENVLDATDSWVYYANENDLSGVPLDVVQTALLAAQADGKEGYKLTLKIPCYGPIMQYADSSELRRVMSRAYSTRASDQAEEGQTRFDNTAIMKEILDLRHEEAVLLGYKNFGEVSVVTKMAKSPKEVMTFLRDIGNRARPYGKTDVTDLHIFAATTLKMNTVETWDYAYVGEKLKEAMYAFSDQEVKQYFTAPKVLDGLFRIAEKLFDIIIARGFASVWNPDVEFYHILRDKKVIASFYLDMPARVGKNGGAWMNDMQSRWLRPDTGATQNPVAQLVCNFASGVNGKPALLTHDDVITMFHEFGHGLHHMLTKVDEPGVAGISGVEWDAVEMPSQFMENFCWEWDVIERMTAHVDTGLPMPHALFDKMIAAKNFHAGMGNMRQVEFSMFDMMLHTKWTPEVDIMSLLEEIRAEMSIIKPAPYSRPAHTFTHIFSGGYAAGYYSYKWAEVLSADVYAAFEENRIVNSTVNVEIGHKYRKAILEVGSSRPIMESFVEFRGREPSIDALMRHSGMV